MSNLYVSKKFTSYVAVPLEFFEARSASVLSYRISVPSGTDEILKGSQKRESRKMVDLLSFAFRHCHRHGFEFVYCSKDYP